MKLGAGFAYLIWVTAFVIVVSAALIYIILPLVAILIFLAIVGHFSRKGRHRS